MFLSSHGEGVPLEGKKEEEEIEDCERVNVLLLDPNIGTSRTQDEDEEEVEEESFCCEVA